MRFMGKAQKFISMLILAGSTTVVAAGAQIQTSENVDYVPGEYVVRLKPGMIRMQSQSLAQSLGAYVKSTIPSLNIVVVKRASFESTQAAVKALSQNALVDIAEPNYIYHINQEPNDPLLGKLWGLKNVGQADSEGHAGVSGVDIDVEKAWDIETGSDKMVVAVVDTGVDFNHPDLKDNLWTNEAELNGQAGVDDDKNGVIDDIHGFNAATGNGNAQDDHGHGSHCAGTIGAKGNDGKGIVGVNWNVKIMAVKFLDKDGSGTLDNALKAVDYATKMGAKVLSNSWGGGKFSQTLQDAVKRSSDAGAIFIAAAGNDGSNNDSTPSYPASFDVPNIVAVAAIDNRGEMASFSNYGKKTVHVAAPGVNIYSSTGGSYDSWSGTSMATPHVSGVAALVWAHEPNLTALELKQRLIQTTRALPSLRGKIKSGGLVNAYNALTNTTQAPDLDDPSNWATQDANYASASPYEKNTNQTYEIKLDNVKQMALYFEKFDTELNYDTLELFDASGKSIQKLSGTNDDSFSVAINGGYVKLVFKSDASVERTGWKISKIAYR